MQMKDSLEFSEPGVSDERSQYGCEVAEAAEGVVDSGWEVLVPVQIGEEVKRQHRCQQTYKKKLWPGSGAKYSQIHI